MADTLQNTPLTINLSNAGFVAGNTNTLTSTATTSCAINGKFAVTLGALTNSATTPTVDATTGLAFPTLVSTSAAGGQAAVLVIGQNAAGTIKMAQGPITPTELGVTTTPGNFLAAPQFPALPDDFVPLAYTVVRTSPTGNSFTAGTTSWAASGITCTTFKNVCTLPARPQIA